MNGLDAEPKTVDVDGSSVRYYITGPEDTPPIVLVHGAGPDAAGVSWKRAFPALAESHRVVAVDLPGYGGSDPVPRTVTPTVEFYVGVLNTVFERLNLVDATLVGISKGGAIALGYALEAPGRVGRLVPVASFGLGDRIPGGRRAAAMLRVPKLLEASWWAMRRSRRVTAASIGSVALPENVDGAFVDDVHRELRRPNAGDAYARFARAEMRLSGPRTNYADRIPELAVETLFIHGKQDPLIPVELSKRAADVAPVADRFTLEGCGHWVPREHPEAFVSRLEAWLGMRRSSA